MRRIATLLFLLAPLTVTAQTATVRLVHGAGAFANQGPVEVYVNDPADDTTPDYVVAHGNSTPSFDLPAGQPVTVRVRLSSGQGGTITENAPPAGRWYITVTGIPTGFQPFFEVNPEGVSRDLDMIFAEIPAGPSFLQGQASADVTLVTVHAVSDAPTLDVVVQGTGQVIANDLQYKQAAPAVTLAPAAYTFEVRRASTGALLRTVALDLTGEAGQGAQLTLTGFLTPANDQNGPPLTIIEVDPTGTGESGVVAGEGGPGQAGALALAAARPSPVRGTSRLVYTLGTAGAVRLAVYDVLGREVALLAEGNRAAGTYEAALDARGLAPGTYVVRLQAGAESRAQRVTVAE